MCPFLKKKFLTVYINMWKEKTYATRASNTTKSEKMKSFCHVQGVFGSHKASIKKKARCALAGEQLKSVKWNVSLNVWPGWKEGHRVTPTPRHEDLRLLSFTFTQRVSFSPFWHWHFHVIVCCFFFLSIFYFIFCFYWRQCRAVWGEIGRLLKVPTLE